MCAQHRCLTGRMSYTAYPSETTEMPSSFPKCRSSTAAALLGAATRYVASSTVASHTYPFLLFILKTDSSNCMNAASAMWLRISPHTVWKKSVK